MRTSPKVVAGERFLALALLLSCGPTLLAQNTWTGATNNWSTASNWSALAEPTATDNVVFPALIPAAGRSVDLSNGELANSLEFLNTYVLRGGTLTLDNGSISVAAGPLGTTTNGTGYGSQIASSLLGTNGLTKLGGGTIFLAGSNLFVGTVNITEGKLSIINDSNLGAIVPTVGGSTTGFNSVNLNNGGYLQLVGNSNNLSANFLQVNRTINISAGGGVIDVVSANGNGNGGAGIETANAFTGTGTLTKSGQGQFFVLNTNNFAGPIVLATTNGGTMDVRATGAFTSAASISVNPGASLNVNNNDGLANSSGILFSTNNQDRIANSIQLILNGGNFTYTSRNAAGQIRETLGTVTLNRGQSTINAVIANNATNGSEIQITTLNRTGFAGLNGGGTINFTGSGTLGTTGNSGRIFIDGMTNQTIVGGYATVGVEFAGYAANGVVAASNALFTSGNANAVTTLPASSNPAANVRTTVAAAVPAGGLTINSLNMTGTGDLTFADASDVLTLASGGILSSSSNRSLGTTTTRGQITPGGPELFFHINGSTTTTVNAVIVDNGAAVALVKDQTGGLTLSAANTYSGGTYSTGFGTITTGGNADTTYLGTGPVFINNGFLVQNARGATTSTAGYTVVNNGRIQLATGGVFQSEGDRYTIEGGSTLYVDNSGAGVGFNSLTRVTTLTAGGQVVLAPDAILGFGLTGTAGQDGVTVPTQGTGVRAIQNLGTAADLYFAPLTGTPSANNVLVVGAGTAFKGLSTDNNGNRGYQGTIRANGDFYVQGLVVPGSNREFNLGNAQALTITNTTSDPIRAFLVGNVRINTGTAVDSAAFTVPSNLTFVATPGSLLTLEGTNALGNTGSAATNAKAIFEAGSILNILANRDIVSGDITFQAGSRFLGDDSSATGSINGIGSLTFEKGAIFDQSQANAFTGTASLVFQTGSIIRIQANSPVLLGSPRNTLATPVGTPRNTQGAVFELFNGNDRVLTGQAIPEDVVISGGGITNDSNNRNIPTGNGRIVVGPGGLFLAATTATTLTLNEDIDLGVNTLSIGTTEPSIAGNPKLGNIAINGGGSRSLATGVIDVLSGNVLRPTATFALPDLATVNLNASTSLLLSQNDHIETIGGLTGSGEVVTTQTGTIPGPNLRVGLNNLSTTFSGSFATGAGNAGLTKIGTGTLTLTGSNTTVRNLNVDQGTLRFADSGTGLFGTYLVAPGATLIVDNTGAAPVTNRLGGTTKNLTIGGNFTMTGGDSATTEALGAFNMGMGGGATVLITPGTAGETILSFTSLGARDRTTLILRGANLGANPGLGVATFTATTPNLFGTVAAGTATTALRPDVLSDSLSSGGTSTLGFVTQDNVTNGFRRLNDSTEYASSIVAGANTNTNVRLVSPFTINPAVNPVVLATDTQIQSLLLATGATSVSNDAGITLAGASTRFVVKSGGVLVHPGVTATITTPYFDNGGTASIFHVYGNLTVDAVLLNNNLIKAGPGTLSLGAGAVRNIGGTIAVNEGTLSLGSNNAFALTTGTIVNAPNLTLAGGSLDLNGNDQTFNQFTSTNATNAANLAGVGGNIVNSGARAQLTAISSNGTNGNLAIASNVFNGSISGPIDFTKAGTNAIAFTNTNTMDGSFRMRGGLIQVREAGAFTAVTSVELNYSNLQLDNRYNQMLEIDNRLASGSALTLRGGFYELLGAVGGNSVQSHTSLAVLTGSNIVNSAASGGGSTELTFASFSRDANSGSTVDFRGSNLGRRAPAGTANQDSRIVITAGLPSTSVYSGSNPSIINGFIGGWATVNGSDFASYLTPAAIVPMNAITAAGVSNWGNTALGYPAYTAATAVGAGFASGTVTNIPNIDVTLPAGTNVTGALRIGDGALRTLAFANATTLLNIESGGLLRTNNNNGTNIGSPTTRGQLTAGGATPTGTVDLYLHFNSSQSNVSLTSNGVSTTVAPNNIIHAVIVDNGSSPVRVVKDLGGAITLTAFNSYTGGTIVNGGTVMLASTNPALGTFAAATIPGNLTINNSTVTLLSQGQILNTAVVAVNNGATLNLSNNPGDTATFSALSFTNEGGGTPQVTSVTAAAAGTVSRLILTGTGVTGPIIAAVNNNAGSTPTIVGTSGNTQIQLDFNDNSTPRTIDVSGSSLIGLIINAPILNGALVKTGSSMLALGQPSGTGAVTSSFTGGLQINAGQVRVDNANALGATNTVTVGDGTLNANTALVVNTGTAIPAGVSLVLNRATLAPLANISIAGSVSVLGDSVLSLNDYYVSTTARNLTISGTLSGSAAISLTASPVITSIGTLLLSNPANNYSGTITMTPNAVFTAQSSTSSGSTVGTASIIMQGGLLNLRDNNSGSSASDIPYGNNITVSGNSIIDVNRVSTVSANVFRFGTLSLGNAILTVQGGNAYSLAFDNTTLTSPNSTINTTSAALTLAVLDGTAGSGLAKYGAAQLNITSPVGTFTGDMAVFAGTLRLSSVNNTYAGTITVNTGGSLLNQNSDLAGLPDTGRTIGSAVVSLNGGTFNVRDNGPGSPTTLDYSTTNLIVSALGGTLDVNRGSGTNIGNTVEFGSLTLGNGTLTVSGGNTYSATMPTANLTGTNSTLNPTSAPLNIGILNGTAGANLIKSGTGQLNIISPIGTFTGNTNVNQGVLRIAATGTALSNGALVVSPGAELRGDTTAGTATFTPSTVTNDGLIRAQSGTMDFGTRFITGAAGPVGTATTSALAERYYRPNTTAITAPSFATNTGDPFITFSNATTFLTATPPEGTNSFTSGNLSLSGATLLSRAGNPAQTVSGTGAQEHLGTSFRGTLTVGGAGNPFQPGVASFGTNSDDGSSIYVDANQNGIFEASEFVVNNLGGHGLQTRVGSILLPTAGDYDFVIGWYNGTGNTQGLSLEARFYPGGTLAIPIPYANQSIINPAGAVFAATNSLQVDTGATLSAGGFTTGTATINGTGILAIASPTPTNSTATTLVNTGAGTLNVGGLTGSDNTLTVAVLSITNGQLMTKEGAGTLYVTGTGSGTGTLNVAAGAVGGTGSIAGPVSVASGARIIGGMGSALNQTLTTGNLTLGTSTFQVAVGNGSVEMDLTGTGASTVAAANFGRAGPGDLITISLVSDGSILTDGTLYTRQVATYTGTLNNLTATTYLPADNVFLVTGANFQVQDYSVTVTGNAVQVSFTAVVPEPVAIGFLATTAMGMGCWIRRRKGIRGRVGSN